MAVSPDDKELRMIGFELIVRIQGESTHTRDEPEFRLWDVSARLVMHEGNHGVGG